MTAARTPRSQRAEGAGHITADPHTDSAVPGAQPHNKEQQMSTSLIVNGTADLDAITEDGPASRVVTITPDLAKALLIRNRRNRRLRERAVSDYARDMQAGHWKVNGEAIKVDVNGNVLDGQHRLRAVIEADVDVDMFVVFGLDPATQETMDSGRKRSTADALHLRDEQNATTLASILRRVWAWQRGDHKFTARRTPTTAECAALLDERPELRRSAEIANRVRQSFPHIPQSVLGTCHHLFNEIDADQCAWFFQRLADGAELPLGHPILALRTRVTSERLDSVRLSEDRFMAYMIRTWNAVRDGRDLARLMHKPGTEIPLPK